MATATRYLCGSSGFCTEGGRSEIGFDRKGRKERIDKMKKLTKTILASSFALAVGCVSRIDIEQWTLEPCDGATTAEIARLVEEGASRDGRVWKNNIPHEERTFSIASRFGVSL